MSTDILGEFTQRLEKHAGSQGCRVHVAPGAFGQHILRLATKPRETLLYVKVSSSEQGFWGLTKNRLKSMESAGSRWYVVLLHRSPDRGYLIPSAEVLARVTSVAWRLSADGDYKVWEGEESNPALRFFSVAECVALLL